MMNAETRTRIGKLMPILTEDQRRKYAALEVAGLGEHGIDEFHELTGMSKTTIYAGLKEVKDMVDDPKAKTKADSIGRIRKAGGGRKSATENQPELRQALLSLLDGYTVGNPENPLVWTTKSLRNLTEELQAQGFKVGKTTVEKLLKEEGFSLQQNRKYVQTGEVSPDRNEQFEHINSQCKAFLEAGQPVISVDTKKKEMIGNYKNNGAEYCHKGEPVKVKDHDFLDPALGRAAPYGIYDIGDNSGFVNVTLGPDTAEFAVNSIRSWWNSMGKERYPNATKLMITCDGGGSNGSRNRLWKKNLQDFANESGLTIYVSHYPAGTSKWNKIEHRMFCFITKNWRGRPLETVTTIVNLIGNTTTKTGLKIKCVQDNTTYVTGIKVSDEELEALNLKRNDWHGEWNYSIAPKQALNYSS